MKILVTGGAGYIGSHIKLNAKWHSVALGQISKTHKPRKFKEI